MSDDARVDFDTKITKDTKESRSEGCMFIHRKHRKTQKGFRYSVRDPWQTCAVFFCVLLRLLWIVIWLRLCALCVLCGQGTITSYCGLSLACTTRGRPAKSLITLSESNAPDAVTNCSTSPRNCGLISNSSQPPGRNRSAA